MTRCFWLVVSLLALAALGCGDDDGGAPDAGPPPVDQCVNASDLAIANALVEVPDGGLPDAGRTDGLVADGVVELMTDALADCVRTVCAIHILQESPELDACLDGCVASSEVAGLSDGCTGCWAELTRCTADHCLTLCAMDIHAAECEACSQTYCTGRFYACTGFDSP